MHLLLMVSKSDFLLQPFIGNAISVKSLSVLLPERSFLPEAIAFGDCSLSTTLSPHFLLPLQAWPGERGQDTRWPWSPDQSGNELCLVWILSHWRKRWVWLLKVACWKELSLGARQMERSCSARQPNQQPQDCRRQGQCCPKAEAVFFVS